MVKEEVELLPFEIWLLCSERVGKRRKIMLFQPLWKLLKLA